MEPSPSPPICFDGAPYPRREAQAEEGKRAVAHTLSGMSNRALRNASAASQGFAPQGLIAKLGGEFTRRFRSSLSRTSATEKPQTNLAGAAGEEPAPAPTVTPPNRTRRLGVGVDKVVASEVNAASGVKGGTAGNLASSSRSPIGSFPARNKGKRADARESRKAEVESAVQGGTDELARAGGGRGAGRDQGKWSSSPVDALKSAIRARTAGRGVKSLRPDKEVVRADAESKATASTEASAVEGSSSVPRRGSEAIRASKATTDGFKGGTASAGFWGKLMKAEGAKGENMVEQSGQSTGCSVSSKPSAAETDKRTTTREMRRQARLAARMATSRVNDTSDASVPVSIEKGGDAPRVPSSMPESAQRQTKGIPDGSSTSPVEMVRKATRSIFGWLPAASSASSRHKAQATAKTAATSDDEIDNDKDAGNGSHATLNNVDKRYEDAMGETSVWKQSKGLFGNFARRPFRNNDTMGDEDIGEKQQDKVGREEEQQARSGRPAHDVRSVSESGDVNGNGDNSGGGKGEGRRNRVAANKISMMRKTWERVAGGWPPARDVSIRSEPTRPGDDSIHGDGAGVAGESGKSRVMIRVGCGGGVGVRGREGQPPSAVLRRVRFERVRQMFM